QLLQTTRKKRLQLLVNNYYNALKKEIEISKDLEQLNDGGYFDERITEVREEYLDSDNSKEKLHILRRSRINRLLGSEEDQRYDLIRDIINNTENIEEISDSSEIFADIKILNQTLLTGNRDKSELERERKTQYNNGLYDIISSAIKIEEDIDKLQKEWQEAIENNLDQNFLTERLKINLQQNRLDRIKELKEKENDTKTPKTPKRSFDKQINFIITQYKKTLSNVDLLKFFPTRKNKSVVKFIKDVYDKSKDKKSLLEVLYLNWVLGKDKKYLLNKKFTRKKINEVNNLVKDINNYLYEEPPEFSWDNPLRMDQEKIDIIKSVDLVMIEYKKSLANILEITEENTNTIQDSLNQLGLLYETGHDKKNFLNTITEVLVNGKDVEEINDNNIKE
ncbi:31249_t:CDS:2, partial [Racocetra persica]